MALVLLAPVVAAVIMAVAARSSLMIVHIRGMSMTPTLNPHDRALAVRVRFARRPRAGQIVVCRTPPMVGDGLLVKRIAAVAGDPLPDGRPGDQVPAGRIFLVGDNDRSTDSRYFGTLPQADVLAVVVVRLWSSR